MIPLKINNKQLAEIFDPDAVLGMTEEQMINYSYSHLMYPTSVEVSSETYSRNAERSANYEMDGLLLVNRKTKPEFTWELLPAIYVQRLLGFLNYHYDFKSGGVIVPEQSPEMSIEYLDFIGMRTINVYLGQTIEGTLVEYDGTQFWENFRIAFPEK